MRAARRRGRPPYPHHPSELDPAARVASAQCGDAPWASSAGGRGHWPPLHELLQTVGAALLSLDPSARWFTPPSLSLLYLILSCIYCSKINSPLGLQLSPFSLTNLTMIFLVL